MPEPGVDPDALKVQFCVAPGPLIVQGIGLYVADAVGATATLVVVVDVELVEDDVVVLVVDPGTVVLVVVG